MRPEVVRVRGIRYRCTDSVTWVSDSGTVATLHELQACSDRPLRPVFESPTHWWGAF